MVLIISNYVILPVIMRSTLSILAMLMAPVLATTTFKGPSIKDLFRIFGIVPQIIPEAPQTFLSDIYGDYRANLGNSIPKCATTQPPITSYPANNNQLYTLIAINPDFPQFGISPTQTLYGLKINIRGSNVQQGDSLVPYIPPNPVPGSGYNRYICLVYKQQAPINITNELIVSLMRPGYNYGNFDIAKFVSRYKLGNPVAGNFFRVRQTLCDPPCDYSCAKYCVG